MYDSNQLHAAVVELVALDNAEIKYSTVQNWYAGDENGKGGIYNFVTKRGLCQGVNSKISWTQVETGSAITWKYPSCVLVGDNSVGEFYSVALTNHRPEQKWCISAKILAAQLFPKEFLLENPKIAIAV
jgi:Fe-S cluster assembly protein SufB